MAAGGAHRAVALANRPFYRRDTEWELERLREGHSERKKEVIPESRTVSDLNTTVPPIWQVYLWCYSRHMVFDSEIQLSVIL